MARRYHIDFDTKDMPGRIKAVGVELTLDVIRDDNKSIRLDLCDHPLYERLERYVLANPSRRRREAEGR